MGGVERAWECKASSNRTYIQRHFLQSHCLTEQRRLELYAPQDDWLARRERHP